MEWLDERFSKLAKGDAWSAWLQLLRLLYKLGTEDTELNVDSNDTADNSVEIVVEIFDDTEPNILDETVYTAFKCYNYMVKHMNNCASLDVDIKEKILLDYSNLKKL